MNKTTITMFEDWYWYNEYDKNGNMILNVKILPNGIYEKQNVNVNTTYERFFDLFTYSDTEIQQKIKPIYKRCYGL